jgi:hypothetical protein
MDTVRTISGKILSLCVLASAVILPSPVHASNEEYDQCVSTVDTILQGCIQEVDDLLAHDTEWYLRSRACWAKYGSTCGEKYPRPFAPTYAEMKVACQSAYTQSYASCQDLLGLDVSCDFPIQGEVPIFYINPTFHTQNAYTEPLDVTNDGVVVGKSYISNTVYHMFTWARKPGQALGVMEDQYSLVGGASTGNSVFSIAHAINNKGITVGQSGINSSLTEYYAYFREPGNGTSQLPLFSGPKSTKNIAYDINDSNIIVGYSLVPGTTGVPVVWTPIEQAPNEPWQKYNAITALPALNTSLPKGVAYALNNNNTIVGRVGNAVGQLTPVMWNMVNNVWNIQTIGTIGGQHGEALGVNSSDVAVGWSNKTGSSDVFAFAWSASKGHTVLNPLSGHVGSYANDISDTGIVVGQSMTSSSVDTATLWPAVGCGPINANSLVPVTSTPWILDKVTAISPNGRYIVGIGNVKAAQGKKHGWMIDLGVK